MKRAYCPALLLSLAAGACTNVEEKDPNIVYIYADDMGYGDIGYLNPNSKIETPNLDNICEQSLVFTDAHTCSSVSSPSRYGVITGRYSWRSRLKRGVLGGFSPALIEKDRPTIASMLHDNGYKTYCIGKWHLGLDGWVNKDGSNVKNANNLQTTGFDVDYANVELSGPTDRGFDYFYGISASLDIPPFLLIENDRVIDEPSHFYKGKSPYLRGGYAVEGRSPSFFLENFTNKVVETIHANSKSEDPFFIYYAVPAPHTPVAPHEDFVGKSEAGSYGDFMMEVDYRIAQVYKALEDAGVADNTIVVISSDNGPETITYERYCETGHCSSGEFKGVKRDIWEGGHRVPMIVTWPNKIKAGRNVEQPISVIDFYATAADIVGHTLTEGEAPDSYSYLPMIESENGVSEREVTIHHSVNGRFAIRKGDWVLIETKTGNDNNSSKTGFKEYYQKLGYPTNLTEGNGELFNLKDDPRQMVNLYSQHPEIVKELTDALNQTRK